jgi:hypothetical protein
MRDVRHACVYCYYTSCHGNAVVRTAAILLRDSGPCDLHTESLLVPCEAKTETYKHSTS